MEYGTEYGMEYGKQHIIKLAVQSVHNQTLAQAL